MRIENYISDLLYRYECVTVPGFGAFITQYQPAKVHSNTNAFYPPSKSIAFNEQLKSNDGLLTKYIAEVLKISFEEASQKVETTVLTWKKALEVNEKIELKNIGELWLGAERKILFQPSYHLNYLTSSFGLSSFVTPAVTREELKKEVEALEEKAPVAFTPERRKSRSYLKYAAVFLLTISAGTIGYRFVDIQQRENVQVAQQEAQQQIERDIQKATFFDTTPLEIPSIILKVEKQPLKYHVIAGAFRVEENADKRVKQLQDKGFEAERIGKNKYGLHQVTYASFAEVPSALEFLRKIKREESPEAWLLVDELD
ncbi:HU-CCDC81 and SPOR domain-containing protein [Galbibacter sp. BG1]|uniref:HU domain-containing protein n=1 Tax=Galbibacter sp. BG1 TaxID=1170699 RepID=UPI0015B84496|nr:SPOR domain-containing protein [Galbibacter sp. BG1]QLE01163.1 HU-CCDC81 and SPOR domain-containing protein [Galbibacter sp. BG1]